MSSFVSSELPTCTSQQTSITPTSRQKRPYPLNRPPIDVASCIKQALGTSHPSDGPPGTHEPDANTLREALQRYYKALASLQGDALIELEKMFNEHLRNLSGSYERPPQDLSQIDRELCTLILRNLQNLEQDLRYHAQAGYEAMGSRLAGRFAGPCSTATLVEATLQWWQNPRDRKLIKDVREAADMVAIRRARGSIRRMQENRQKVEQIKQSLKSAEGELHWESCLHSLGMEQNDLSMVQLFVAAAEEGWRVEAGNDYSELAVDLGADQNSSRCIIFPLPFPASARDELLPVMAIISLNDELYGLLTGDRWFKVHSAHGIGGAIILARYVEIPGQPETWAISEHRHQVRVNALTAKDCAWLAQLLDGDPVEEVKLLYENLTRHAQRGHHPNGRDVGVSIHAFREALEKKRLLTTSGVIQIMTTRTVSTMFSLTGSRRSFSRALAELVLGTVSVETVIRSSGKRVEIEAGRRTWCFKVSGSSTKRPKDLETVLATLIRLAGKRGISCRVEGAELRSRIDDAPTLGPMRGRIGLSCMDLWYSRYDVPARIESPDH